MAKNPLYPYLTGYTALLTEFGADANYLQDVNDKTEAILNHTHQLILSDLSSIFYSLFGTNIIHTEKHSGRYITHEYTDLNKVFVIKIKLGLNTYLGYHKKAINVFGIRRVINVESPLAKSKAIHVGASNRVQAPTINIHAGNYVGNLQNIDPLYTHYMQAPLDPTQYVVALKNMLNEQICVIDSVRKIIAANINYTEIP